MDLNKEDTESLLAQSSTISSSLCHFLALALELLAVLLLSLALLATLLHFTAGWLPLQWQHTC